MDGAAWKKPLGKKGKEESIGRGADIEEEEEEGGKKWRETRRNKLGKFPNLSFFGFSRAKTGIFSGQSKTGKQSKPRPNTRRGSV